MRVRGVVGAGRINRRQPSRRLVRLPRLKAALNQILRTFAIEVARSRPEAIVVGLHPGTVASDLSQPFRPDPTADGVFLPETKAAYLFHVLNGLSANDTGGVFAWDGSPIPA